MARRTWSSALVGVLLVGVCALPATSAEAAPRAAAATAGSAHATITTAQFKSRLLALVNARRKKVGCGALRTNTALASAAAAHTTRMATSRNLSHQLPGELGLAARIVKAGYKKWSGLAENVAWGATTPDRVFTLWLNSAGHRANMQHCGYHDAGFGVVVGGGSTWVTLDLGSHR
jgi:uncharacterized protein YkwD